MQSRKLVSTIKKAHIIPISALDRDGVEQFKEIDMAHDTTQTFSVFGREAGKFTLEFFNQLISLDIDRFGKDIPIRKTDKGHFQCVC